MAQYINKVGPSCLATNQMCDLEQTRGVSTRVNQEEGWQGLHRKHRLASQCFVPDDVYASISLPDGISHVFFFKTWVCFSFIPLLILELNYFFVLRWEFENLTCNLSEHYFVPEFLGSLFLKHPTLPLLSSCCKWRAPMWKEDFFSIFSPCFLKNKGLEFVGARSGNFLSIFLVLCFLEVQKLP